MSEYYAPKNFNFWYIFGSLALLVLVIQIVTGIFLVMHYKPDAALAFGSVEYIMRDVPWGWLIRYMHSTGASAFFVVVYLHMFRGLMYGSYRKPRELVWVFGCAIFLCLMAEAFMGYLLPWGQMSYWGAQVIVNLFSAIPFIGPDLALLIRGDYVVGDATLNRFFSFHVIAVPLVLLGLVVAHIIALHDVGSNNPDGIEIKGPKARCQRHPLDGIPFHPYYTVHDIFAVSVFLMVFTAIVFFAPEFGGYFLEYNNFIPADPLQDAAAHCAGLVLHAVLFDAACHHQRDDVRADPVRGGAAVAGRSRSSSMPAFKGAIIGAAVVAVGPDAGHRCQVLGCGRDGRRRHHPVLPALAGLQPGQVDPLPPDWHKYLYGIFVINFLILAYLGVQPPSPIGERVSQVGTLFYFGFFLLMPWWSRWASPSRCRTVSPLPRTEQETTTMKKLILTLIARAGILAAGGRPCAGGDTIAWDKAPNKTNDLAALQNGAKLFVNYCLNCHSAAFMRYNRLTDIGLTEQQIKDNLLFTTAKVGETMKAAIDPKQAKEWFGANPPDLTVIGRSRSPRAGHRRRLPVHLPAHLLPGRHQGYRLEQPGLPQRRHAACAVGTAGDREPQYQ
jgi:ubiquinol-cytochrome c reductase cytochrome b subunit